MSIVFKVRGRTLAAASIVAGAGLIASVALAATPANAAVLFADNFEQLTVNVWLTGGGGSWSVVTEDGSKVYRQSSTTLTPTAWAGSGSGPGTVVSARVKPTSALGASNLVGLAGRVSDPNNLYYAGLRNGRLEIGQQAWGTNVVLASTPFAAGIGSWYTVSLSFLTPGTVTGSVAGAGTSATVSAPDPGGPNPGDRVGFYLRSASASFDDIQLSNALPPSPSPTGPCPAAIALKLGVNYGTTFTATLSFRNVSSTPIAPPWTITWRYNQGQVVASVFNASFFQVGPVVTIKSVPWFPAVAPGATSGVMMGLTVNGPIQAPVDATFNGVPCTLTFT
jgi:hypothetical protein